MVFPLTIHPDFSTPEVSALQKTALHAPIYLTDFKPDIGVPKGTAFVSEGLLPFSMGNEPFDGFLVLKIPAPMAWPVALIAAPHQRIWAERVTNVSTPLNVGRFQFDSCRVSADQSWVAKAAPSFAAKLVGTLGQFRRGSASKYVEHCVDEDGQNYLVVHAGAGNIASLFLTFANAMSRLEDSPLIEAEFHPESQAGRRLLWLLDVMERAAWLNRILIAKAVLADSLERAEVVFHETHAFITKTDQGYLHGNSIHRAMGDVGFMSGQDGNVLFCLTKKLTDFGFYPHQTCPTSLARDRGYLGADDVSLSLEIQDWITARKQLVAIRRMKAV